MNHRFCAVVALCILIAAVFGCGCTAPLATPPAGDTGIQTDEEILVKITSNIETVLTTIGESTADAAEALSTEGEITSAAAQPILDELYSATPYALSFAVVDPKGTIIAVAPETYADSIGVNISSSEPGNTIVSSDMPYFSEAFVAVEGFTGIEISSPITGEERTGTVLAMADPSVFVGDIVQPVEEAENVTVTVMQPDGFILYDQDPAQVGKNLFTDQPFTGSLSLLALGHDIAASPMGNGEYIFYRSADDTNTQVQKNTRWDSCSYLGREWRVILFRETV